LPADGAARAQGAAVAGRVRVIVAIPAKGNRTMRLRVSCLSVLLFAASAQAQLPPPGEDETTVEDAARMQEAQEAMQSYYARVATELAANGGARELAFAASLLQVATAPPPRDVGMAGDAPSQPSPRDPRVEQWRSLASARAGKDVLANALLMQADAAPGGAVQAPAAGRWQQLEPDNLAPRLHGAAPVDSWLPDARKDVRFDMHYYEQARWMQSALLAHPPGAQEAVALADGQELPAEASAALMAMGMLAATATPQLQPLFRACQGDALASAPTRREDCRHVASIMADASDTSLGRSIGIALLQSTAATPAQAADADARRSRLDWQMQQWGRISASQPFQGASELADLLRDPAIRDEQALVERVLGEAGVPLDPPAGWRPQRR
jgi:hypothetical protein